MRRLSHPDSQTAPSAPANWAWRFSDSESALCAPAYGAWRFSDAQPPSRDRELWRVMCLNLDVWHYQRLSWGKAVMFKQPWVCDGRRR